MSNIKKDCSLKYYIIFDNFYYEIFNFITQNHTDLSVLKEG
jgi:hypothetical protein